MKPSMVVDQALTEAQYRVASQTKLEGKLASGRPSWSLSEATGSDCSSEMREGSVGSVASSQDVAVVVAVVAVAGVVVDAENIFDMFGDSKVPRKACLHQKPAVEMLVYVAVRT